MRPYSDQWSGISLLAILAGMSTLTHLWRERLMRFAHNRLAVLGESFVVVMFLMAALAPHFWPFTIPMK